MKDEIKEIFLFLEPFSDFFQSFLLQRLFTLLSFIQSFSKDK